MACQITYKNKTYPYNEWVQELNNGMFDQLVTDNRINTSKFSKPFEVKVAEQQERKSRDKTDHEEVYNEAIRESINRKLDLDFIPNQVLMNTDRPVELKARQRVISKRLDVLNKLVNCI